MAEIIDFAAEALRRRPASDVLSNGSLDLFKAKNGKTGVDACVPDAVWRAFGRLRIHGLLSASQGEVGGNWSFESHVSAATAACIADIAERHGVAVRR